MSTVPVRAIWKFPIDMYARPAEQMLRMPEGSHVISAQLQHLDICLWAIVKPDAPMVDVPIYVAGTGRPLPDLAPFKFIDTIQIQEFVWHVFVHRKAVQS